MKDPYSKYDNRRTLSDCFVDMFAGDDLDEEVASCTFKTYGDGSTAALAPCGTIVAYVKGTDIYTVVPTSIPDFLIKPMRAAIKAIAKQRGVGWRSLTKERRLHQLIAMQSDREFYEQFLSSIEGGDNARVMS